MTRSAAHPHRRFVLVAIIAPLVITVVAAAAQAALLPRLPETVAIHWDAAGEADGYGPAWSFPALTLVLGVGLVLLLGGMVLVGERAAARAHARTGLAGGQMRFIGALLPATVAFLSVLATALAALQTGSAAPDAPPVGLPLLAGLGAGVLAGIAGWFAQPRAQEIPEQGVPVEPLPIAAGESAVWARTATTSRGPALLLVGIAVAVLGTGVGLVATGSGAAGWVVLATGVPLVLLVIAALAHRVIVDDTGLVVRSMVGVPRWHVASSDIRAARVVFVNAMGEFGGWGWRWTPGRFGIVTRSGEALQITREDGRQFVVTVDDAATGAALLQALVERRAGLTGRDGVGSLEA